MFRQLVAAGLLEVDTEGYGGLRLTAGSRDVLQGRREVHLRKEAPRARGRGKERSRDARAVPVDMPAEARPLFEALRELRTRLSREQGVPPYVIFHDATLRGIATLRPATTDELAGVPGIGAGKLERYGELVLETVRAA